MPEVGPVTPPPRTAARVAPGAPPRRRRGTVMRPDNQFVAALLFRAELPFGGNNTTTVTVPPTPERLSIRARR